MKANVCSIGIVLLILTGGFIGILNLASENAQASWSIETLDSVGAVGTYTSIALDSNGYAHISYYDVTTQDLKYANWIGSTWNIETIDSAGSVGEYTSLAIDSKGYAHISYYDYTNGNIKHANWTGSAWSKKVVDITGSLEGYTSIALNGSDYPRVAYYDDFLVNDLKYAKWTGSTWSIETVDSIGFVGKYLSLALDNNGYAHISYRDDTNNALKYANWTGSSWNIETVDSDGSVGGYTSIALDSVGYPHISYRDWTNLALKYARWTGNTWSIETVDDVGNTGGDTSIALDINDNAHITYGDATNGYLKYARWTGSEWWISTVDGNGDVGGFTSLALDSSGRAHISYYDRANYDLKYAKEGPPTVPSAPQNLKAETGDKQVTLTWNEAMYDGGSQITNYSIYRGTMSGGEVFLTTIGNVLNFTDTGLTNGQTYYYKVSAVNALGESPQSNEVQAIPLAVPSAPRDLKAIAGDSKVTLTWTEPSSDGGSPISGYIVYRNSSWLGQVSSTHVGNVLTYEGTDLENGKTYYYTVVAQNAVGRGERSNEVSVVPGKSIFEQPWFWNLILIIIVVFIIVALIISARRKKRKSKDEIPAENGQMMSQKNK